MEKELVIFDSEMKFRSCVTSHPENVFRIIIFEDILEHVIFFYCVGFENLIYAAKDFDYKHFSSFVQTYIEFAKQFNLYFTSETHHLIISKEEQENRWF